MKELLRTLSLETIVIRLRIRLKKRNKLDSDLEQLRCALEKLTEVIMQEIFQIPKSAIRKMRKAGIRGSRAGVKLQKIVRKK